MSKIRRYSTFTLILAVALVVTLPASAGAIINGIPDGDRHRNTGAVVWLEEQLVFCSSFLIAPRYVATAGHCLEGFEAADITVTFDEVPDANSTYYRARTLTIHPEFDISAGGGLPFFGLHDYGLIELERPANGVPEADLAPIGTADDLPRGQPVMETAGYGATDTKGQMQTYPDTRHYAKLALSKGNARVTQTHLKVSGKHTAACFGDSGGPTYLGADLSVVYGITSFVTDFQCAGWNYQIRTDTQEAHDFYGAVD